MPSSMTHTYFGLDVKNKLPQNCKNKIDDNLEYFKLFCQGPDPYMFYHFFLGKQAKEKINIQKTLHQTKTKEFFINIIKTIQKHNLSNNSSVMTYLYGYICHYYLDLNTHPIINYQESCFKKIPKYKNKSSIHQEIEYNIDLYMIKQRESTLPYKFKVYNHIFNINSFNKELETIINESMEETYNYKDIAKTYLTCIRYMKLFFKYINHDPTGIKLKIYQFIDKIKPKNTIRLEELSYHHDFESNLDYLNLNHSSWHLPWDKTKTYTTSFFDLYEKALTESVKTINTVTEMLETNNINQKELDNIFKDISYSGKPYKKKNLL